MGDATKRRIRETFEAHPALAEAVIEAGALAEARAGETLFAEGGLLEAMPLVVSGRVRVFRTTADGAEITQYEVDPGEICVIAAASILSHKPYPAQAVATAPTAIWRMPRAAFRSLFDAYPAFRRFVFDQMTRRFFLVMGLVEEVAFMSVEARLAGYLLHHGPAVTATHQEIAAHLGTAREVVTRALRKMERSGIVDAGRGRVAVRDEAALHAVAGTSGPRSLCDRGH